MIDPRLLTMKETLVLAALAGLVASSMMLIHRWFAFLRREAGKLPRSSIAAQRVLASLPLAWLATFVALVLSAYITYDEWPGPRRMKNGGWGTDPTWPDPDHFGWLILGYRLLTLSIVLGWILYLPLAWNTRRTHQTPRAAGFASYLALHGALILYWVWDPGDLVEWAMD